MAEIKGSCRCGKVHYTISADPIFTGICHCTSCRKSTGSAYSTVVGVPTPALTVTGVTTQFDDVGDSGKATHRSFCPACGTTVTQTADVMEGITMVGLGTLDDQGSVTPGMQIFLRQCSAMGQDSGDAGFRQNARLARVATQAPTVAFAIGGFFD